MPALQTEAQDRVARVEESAVDYMAGILPELCLQAERVRPHGRGEGMKINSILSSNPIDKTAAKVIGTGNHFEPKIKPHSHEYVHSDIPLPIKSPLAMSISQFKNNNQFVDLTGAKIGWLTVVGASPEYHGRWVVRCVCGAYEIRTAKAIKNKKNDEDRCIVCRAVKHITTYKSNGSKEFKREHWEGRI
jgi:hypothetical protein